MSMPRATYKGMTIVKDRVGYRVKVGQRFSKAYKSLTMATTAIDIKKFASKN